MVNENKSISLSQTCSFEFLLKRAKTKPTFNLDGVRDNDDYRIWNGLQEQKWLNIGKASPFVKQKLNPFDRTQFEVDGRKLTVTKVC
jgi:hypothetical protein